MKQDNLLFVACHFDCLYFTTLFFKNHLFKKKIRGTLKRMFILDLLRYGSSSRASFSILNPILFLLMDIHIPLLLSV